MKKVKQVAVVKSRLESALAFLSLAHSTHSEQSMFAGMGNNEARSFNMVIGLGTAIEEDLICCPHIELLLAAIERCGGQYAITQLSPQKLLVRSGEFQAYIPCLDAKDATWCVPDAPVGVLDDRFMDALGKVAGLAVTKAETVLESSIQLNSGSVIATDRLVIMEAWHGIDFPDGLLIPKLTYNVLKKTKKAIKHFGFSSRSITFYFADDSWLFSMLYEDKWPAYINHSIKQVTPAFAYKIPPGFFDAVKKVHPFSAGRIFVQGNQISSHPPGTIEEGSTLTLTFEGEEHEPRSYPADALKSLSSKVELWEENGSEEGTFFFGEGIRGAISHDRYADHEAGTNAPTSDEDIPF